MIIVPNDSRQIAARRLPLQIQQHVEQLAAGAESKPSSGSLQTQTRPDGGEKSSPSSHRTTSFHYTGLQVLRPSHRVVSISVPAVDTRSVSGSPAINTSFVKLTIWCLATILLNVWLSVSLRCGYPLVCVWHMLSRFCFFFFSLSLSLARLKRSAAFLTPASAIQAWILWPL